MIEPIVRMADRADVAQLITLEAEARAGLVGKRGGDRWLAEHRERGTGWAQTVDEEFVFVAVIDEVLVGYLAGRILASDDRAPDVSVGVVAEVFVDPQARECGFGTALLDAVLAAFVDGGATVVDATALPGDRETKNLYERAGITARLITLSAPLPPSGIPS